MPTKRMKLCAGLMATVSYRRWLPNGELDKFDTVDWPLTICSTCGGSGEVTDADFSHVSARD